LILTVFFAISLTILVLIFKILYTNSIYVRRMELCQIKKLVLLKDMVDAYNWQIDNGRHALENGAAKLQTLSPLAVLGRGYALVQKEGLPIKSITDTSIGENLEMVLRDGKLLCEVKGITEG